MSNLRIIILKVWCYCLRVRTVTIISNRGSPWQWTRRFVCNILCLGYYIFKHMISYIHKRCIHQHHPLMPQPYYHVSAATLYLRCWHPRFEEIGVDFGWVPRCVTMYYVVATLKPRRGHVIVQCRHAWQVTLASLVTLCYAMSRYRHAVASLPPRCRTLCQVTWWSIACHNVLRT